MFLKSLCLLNYFFHAEKGFHEENLEPHAVNTNSGPQDHRGDLISDNPALFLSTKLSGNPAIVFHICHRSRPATQLQDL